MRRPSPGFLPQWDDDDSHLPEPERVFRHRYLRFRELGFTRVEARLLADSPADLHLAEDLKEAGCPLLLIEEIVT